jgi:hypothetical protein
MTPAQTDVERVARDLEHTGELSMPYRCEIADMLRDLAGHTQHKAGLTEDARIMQKRIGSTPFPEGFQQIADDAHVMIARQAFRIADLEKRIAAMQPSVVAAAKVLCATELPYYVVEMPLTESGNGPATIGFDAAKMTYEVWDAYTLEIVGAPYELLSDANRAWLRALAKGATDDR